MGACFRSGDAFESTVWTFAASLAIHHIVTLKALGASDHVPWTAHENTLAAVLALKKEGWKVAALEQAPESLPLQQWRPSASQRWAVVVGNEVRGVSDEVLAACDEVIEMPQYGVKQSINVSVCAGVALWQAALHLRHA